MLSTFLKVEMENFKCLNTVKKMNFVKIMSSVNTRNLCCSNANTHVCLYFYFEGIKVPFSWNPFGHKKLKCLSMFEIFPIFASCFAELVQ